MKAEEWAILIIVILSFIISCGGYSSGSEEDDYQEINRSINGIAL
jgi:hypothetical protein